MDVIGSELFANFAVQDFEVLQLTGFH